jgi:hypothetical protein
MCDGCLSDALVFVFVMGVCVLTTLVWNSSSGFVLLVGFRVLAGRSLYVQLNVLLVLVTIYGASPVSTSASGSTL